MARTTSKPPNNVEPIRNPEDPQGAIAVEDPPSQPATPQSTPTHSHFKKAPGDPPKFQTFFQRVSKIAPEDWGHRAKIRLYRLAPIIDRLRGSQLKFITMYEEPVDEDRIKHDWGSGRYRLYLNFKVPTEKNEKELDSTEIDILDMKFPPNVPLGEWVEDPRNKQWAWAKNVMPSAPPATPPPSPSLGIEAIADVLKFGSDLRREMRDELKPEVPVTAAAPVPLAVDPFDTAKKIMEMRSNDPMITLLLSRMDAQDKAMEEARKREFELQKELRQQSTPAITAGQPRTLIEQLTELASGAEKLKGLVTLFGGGTAAAESGGSVIRSRMSGWMELVRDVVPEIVNSPLANGIAAKLQASAMTPQVITNAPVPHANGNGNGARPPAGPQTVVPNPDDFAQWMAYTITPALITSLHGGDTGAEFAEWVEQGYGTQRVIDLQNFTHPLLPGLKGESAIIAGFQNTKAWAQLQQHETRFREFVHEFCTWQPEPEDIEQPVPVPEGGVVDFDAEFNGGENNV